MDKINPLLYITDTDPVPEAVLDASGWFETEYLEIKSTDKAAEYLEWYMAQGWTLVSSSNVEVGKPAWFWESYATVSNPTPPSFEQIGYARWTGTGIGGELTRQEVEVAGRYLPPGQATIYQLKRRKLQAERCLQDMIQEFTDAYNEGRQVNDDRYDELVTLYNVMLDKSETEIAGLDTLTSDYSDVVESIIAAMPTDYSAHKDEVDGILDDWGDSMRAEVNTRFDNELAKAQQNLVDRGMANTTLLTSVNAGIESERSKALTDLEDKIVERQLALKDRLYTLKVEVEKRTMEAHARLLAVTQDHVLKPLEFRNTIFQAMLAMMERRTDDYPGLDGLANIAAQLGFSDGAATVAPTAG